MNLRLWFRLVRERQLALQLAAWLGAATLLGCSSEDGTSPCGAAQLDCGECVDASTNLQHCGACGNACGAGESCVGGTCRCAAGTSECGSSCANLQTDPDNCGQCGRECADGMLCSNGSCAATCAAGLTACGASCVNLSLDSANCGDCTRSCRAGEVCTAGTCGCSPERRDCGGQCVAVESDAANCGECGNACGTNELCAGGLCQPAPGGGGAGSGGNANGGQTGSGTGGLPPTGTGGSSSGGAGTGGTSSGGASSGGTDTGGTSSGGTDGGGGAPSGCGATGFYVENQKLYDVSCNELILRGVNYPYVWFASRNTQADFAAIAATGANAVRIVLSTGGRDWARTSGSTLSSLIGWAKAAKLVAVVEVHDATGYGEQSGAIMLSTAASYWTSAEIAGALKGQEAYVILNIANEPFGNGTEAEWAPAHASAVTAIRGAGLTHTLMVDAPNWGQDWQNLMRDGGGSSIWNADPQKNLVFSVHMYDVYGQSNIVTSYFNTYLDNYDAPLVVGEFAADHGVDKNVDEDTIMALSEQLGVGYLGWSWSGNGDGLQSLDITNGFDANSLTTWGTRLIKGANGIEATSDLCTCF